MLIQKAIPEKNRVGLRCGKMYKNLYDLELFWYILLTVYMQKNNTCCTTVTVITA